MVTQSKLSTTQLLLQVKDGKRQAIDDLTPLVYNELRKLASHYLVMEYRRRTIQTTELVHEAYLRLIDERHFSPENRLHFFSVAARAMRQLLIQNARKRNAGKRGGGAERLSLDENAIAGQQRSQEILALDAALSKLGELDERLARVVELRYFSGLTIEETAMVLSISSATVKRDWITAKAWLARALRH